jgi:hypothetical protein
MQLVKFFGLLVPILFASLCHAHSQSETLIERQKVSGVFERERYSLLSSCQASALTKPASDFAALYASYDDHIIQSASRCRLTELELEIAGAKVLIPRAAYFGVPDVDVVHVGISGGPYDNEHFSIYIGQVFNPQFHPHSKALELNFFDGQLVTTTVRSLDESSTFIDRRTVIKRWLPNPERPAQTVSLSLGITDTHVAATGLFKGRALSYEIGCKPLSDADKKKFPAKRYFVNKNYSTDRPNCLTSKMQVSLDGKQLLIPAAAYRDLDSPQFWFSSIEQNKDWPLILTANNGDAAGSYIARFYFNEKRLVKSVTYDEKRRVIQYRWRHW